MPQKNRDLTATTNQAFQTVEQLYPRKDVQEYHAKNKILRAECEKLHSDDNKNFVLTYEDYYQILFHGMAFVNEQELLRLPARLQKWESERQQWFENRKQEINEWVKNHPGDPVPAFGHFARPRPKWKSGDEQKITFVKKGKQYFCGSISDVYDISCGKDDVYVCPVAFNGGRKKDDCINWIYAFVIDVDQVQPEDLIKRLQLFARGTYPAPTMIVNSGKGLHLYYILDEPLYTYPSVRQDASQLYELMHQKLSKFVPKVDKHSLGQAYRPVGALTKFNTVVMGFLYGEYWSIQELADIFGYLWEGRSPHRKPTEKMIKYATDLSKQYKTDLPDLNDYDATHEFIQTMERRRNEDPVTPKMKSYAAFLAKRYQVDEPDYGNYDETYNFISCWNKEYQIDKKKNQKGGDIKDWYNNTVERVLTDTQLNHRYYSCVALCVIAYKNDVPIETVTADLNRIADDWALREDWKHDPFKRANLKNALRCYSDKYLTVSSEQLEEWLGWKFQEAKKERKPQQEFLREEAERKVKKTRQAIAAAICENPYANITEIAKIAGVSRPTVYKHIDAVKKLLDNNQQGNVDSSCK